MSTLLRKCRWVLMAGLFFISMLPVGCLSQSSNTSNSIKIDYLDTASSVTITNGQRDWRKYTQQKDFPSGYTGELWITYRLSNVLHNRETHIYARIYILSGEETKEENNKEANLSNSSDNTLFWGDSFNISAYPNGSYSVLLMIDDLISGVTVGTNTDFSIGGAS